MNAAGSPQTRLLYIRSKNQQGWDLPIGHSRRDDQFASSIARAAGAPWVLKGAQRPTVSHHVATALEQDSI